MRLSELAAYLQATISWPASLPGDDFEVKGVASLEHATAGEVSFVTSAEYARRASASKASAIIAAQPFEDGPQPTIVHKNPYWAFAKTAQLFFKMDHGPEGVSALAYVAPDATLGERVTIHPFAYVGSQARIGNDCVLYPGVYVGPRSEVGDASILRPQVVLEHGVKVGRRCLVHAGAVLGADGFGFAPGEGSIAKIPQIGSVVVEDDVEIGALTSIDRGALSDTRIGRDSKLDSHVHVGHGAVIGEHSMLCGMSAVGGSARIGDWVILAGHAGVANNIQIASGSSVAAMTGVIANIEEKGVYAGFPAQPAPAWRRQVALQKRLPDWEKRLRDLEKRLAAIEEASAAD